MAQLVETLQPSTNGPEALPVGAAPTPTQEYVRHRELTEVVYQPWAETNAAAPAPVPPAPPGCRALIWKQDPTVSEIGIRKVYLPGLVVTGPRDARIINGSPGIPPVNPNALGDYIQTPGTDAFDAVHSFAVVREVLTMYQRVRGGAPLPWAWNSTTNTDPLEVFPHGLPGTMNAFYSRSQKALKFGDFIKPGSSPPQRVFTCRSFDIVAHECGHAILDGLKPGWLLLGNPPQTGALHESFGDLTAIFLAMSQLDQVEGLIAQTKANLHDKNFLSDLAEEFGLALGRPNGLRNADNDLKLSQVSNEVHELSQVFTGAIYDVLADLFAFERNQAKRDDAAVLYEVVQYLCGLVLRGIMAAPASGAGFADVANQMLNLAAADGKPVQYRNFIRNRFVLREVVVSPTPLTANHEEGLELAPAREEPEDAEQNRRGCCGTMLLAEYTVTDYKGDEDLFQPELDQLRRTIQQEFRHPGGGTPAARPGAAKKGKKHA